MSKRLLEKAGMIGQSVTAVPAVLNRSTPPTEPHRAKTAPGAMLSFLSAQSEAVQESADLKERLRAFEGASPVRELDPARIRPSKWANRHGTSFTGSAFSLLKDEIRQAGGNVQPIKVRPVVKSEGDSSLDADYEIVFGHRRHRACLELGLPVGAMVDSVSDLELFEQMDRENRGRKNLCAWEQGMMYKLAIDGGLFPSQRQLSSKLGVDLSLVSKALALARLPAAVIDAFASPLDIQFRWAQPLSEAVQKDPEGILARAKEIASKAGRPAPARIMEWLVGRPMLNGSTPVAETPIIIAKNGRTLATIETDAKGRTIVRFEPESINPEKRLQLARILENFFVD